MLNHHPTFSLPANSEAHSAALQLAREGVAFTGDNRDLYVCGGGEAEGESAADTALATSFERVLHLDTMAATWDMLTCYGDIPLPRKNHSLVAYKNTLLMCGGELLSDATIDGSASAAEFGEKSTPIKKAWHRPISSMRPPQLLPNEPNSRVPYSVANAQLLSLFSLDLTERKWSRMNCHGEVPYDRCAHSATLVGSTMILLGGRPPLRTGDALTQGEYLSNEGMAALRREGYFDVHVLHLQSMVWQRVHTSRNDPMRSPMLWGHASLCPDGRHVVAIGGMDVGSSGAVATVHDPSKGLVPEAALNAYVYILDSRSLQWERLATGYTEHDDKGISDIPRPAVHQTALLIPNSDEILVLGGWSPIGGTMGECSNPYVFNVTSKQWRRVPCPSATVFGGCVVACSHGGHVIALKAHDSVYALDCHVRPLVQGWQVFPCRLGETLVKSRTAFLIRDLTASPPPVAVDVFAIQATPTGKGRPTNTISHSIPSDSRLAKWPLTYSANEERKRHNYEDEDNSPYILEQIGKSLAQSQDQPSSVRPASHSPSRDFYSMPAPHEAATEGEASIAVHRVPSKARDLVVVHADEGSEEDYVPARHKRHKSHRHSKKADRSTERESTNTAAWDRRQRLQQLQDRLEEMKEKGELTREMKETLRTMKKETRRLDKILTIAASGPKPPTRLSSSGRHRSVSSHSRYRSEPASDEGEGSREPQPAARVHSVTMTAKEIPIIVSPPKPVARPTAVAHSPKPLRTVSAATR